MQLDVFVLAIGIGLALVFDVALDVTLDVTLDVALVAATAALVALVVCAVVALCAAGVVSMVWLRERRDGGWDEGRYTGYFLCGRVGEGGD